MERITFDYSKANSFVSTQELEAMKSLVKTAHILLHEKRGAGNEFLGWLDLPEKYDREEFALIEKSAAQIKEQADILIVIGIGGSYLGARAVIELLGSCFYNNLSKEKRKNPQIYFAGNNLSSSYLTKLMHLTEGKEIALNVVSKSGTTTEPALAFRFWKQLLEKKYGKKEAGKRIYVTTDQKHGVLKKLAQVEGYTSFVIPDDIGGRYSVLTAVGLLPIAVAGGNIRSLLQGALSAQNEYSNCSLKDNACYQYAAMRNILARKGKDIELLVNYEPDFLFFAEWWKQLFGESEGKDGKGIFPAAVNFSTDLHSMGQYIQEGRRNLFETIIQVEEIEEDLLIEEDPEDLDGLNFLAGKSMHFINQKALAATLFAHTDGGVPNLLIKMPQRNEYYLGNLIYFFEKSCAISGYLLGVNPFNQPGVENYKKNMFALLGKPGYETERERLENR